MKKRLFRSFLLTLLHFPILTSSDTIHLNMTANLGIVYTSMTKGAKGTIETKILKIVGDPHLQLAAHTPELTTRH